MWLEFVERDVQNRGTAARAASQTISRRAVTSRERGGRILESRADMFSKRGMRQPIVSDP
jgi:hypothetical protein